MLQENLNAANMVLKTRTIKRGTVPVVDLVNIYSALGKSRPRLFHAEQQSARARRYAMKGRFLLGSRLLLPPNASLRQGLGLLMLDESAPYWGGCCVSGLYFAFVCHVKVSVSTNNHV